MRLAARSLWLLLPVVAMLGACSAGASPETPPTTPATTDDAGTVMPEVTGLPGEPLPERVTPRANGFDGAPLGYLEYLPSGYGDGEPRPLLVFLHGIDVTGDGSEPALGRISTTGGGGTPPALIEADEWPEARPFVVLSPQYDTVWLTGASDEECQLGEDLEAFLRFAIDRYEVDEARVYLTGLSCGAIGIWDYLDEHGDELVAAAVPIAGHTASAGCTAAAVPVWAFHGADDTFVPFAHASGQIESLKECDGAQVELTVYPDTDHDAWSQTYDLSAGHDVYAWLLEHER